MPADFLYILICIFLVRTYHNAEMSATDLIDTLWEILDRRVDATGSIIKGVSDLIESPEKQREILAAWNDFRIEVGNISTFLFYLWLLTSRIFLQRDSFPSLAPTAPTHWGRPTASAAPAIGSRAVKKPSSSRGPQRSATVWARVELAATSPSPRVVPGLPSERFPALAPSSVASAAARSSTPWSRAGASPTTASRPTAASSLTFVDATPRQSTAYARAPAVVQSNNTAEFPGLPTSEAVAKRNLQKKALFGGGTNQPVRGGSPWGAGGGTTTTTTNGTSSSGSRAAGLADLENLSLDEGGGSEAAGKGKGKKKKQVLLYRA
jgi:hypothetical protein